ncbi:MAG: hypothetical protein KAS53_01145 [Candidatus Cloacimonetes bacterium]|nr:hypothetical protein [Candidatus Cloacimonadota bacterium]
MKNLISFKLAGKITIAIIVLLIIFHILLLLGVVPSDIVWGGKTTDEATILKLEIFSLVTSLILLGVIFAKLRQSINIKFRKVTNITVWIIFGYFTLNIIGNLASGVTLEKLIFTPITIILSLLLFRLAIEK